MTTFMFILILFLGTTSGAFTVLSISHYMVFKKLFPVHYYLQYIYAVLVYKKTQVNENILLDLVVLSDEPVFVTEISPSIKAKLENNNVKYWYNKMTNPFVDSHIYFKTPKDEAKFWLII